MTIGQLVIFLKFRDVIYGRPLTCKQSSVPPFDIAPFIGVGGNRLLDLPLS